MTLHPLLMQLRLQQEATPAASCDDFGHQSFIQNAEAVGVYRLLAGATRRGPTYCYLQRAIIDQVVELYLWHWVMINSGNPQWT
jgi:hypothetical protein